MLHETREYDGSINYTNPHGKTMAETYKNELAYWAAHKAHHGGEIHNNPVKGCSGCGLADKD